MQYPLLVEEILHDPRGSNPRNYNSFDPRECICSSIVFTHDNATGRDVHEPESLHGSFAPGFS